MRPLFITATGTGVGKTYTMLRLIRHFGSRGIRVTPFKPVETGVSGVPQDAAALLESAKPYNPSLANMSPDDICPLQYPLPAAPFVAKGETALDIEKIETSFERLRGSCDLLLIEGAGGLMVPLEADFFMIDLITLLEGHTLLVTHDRLGCINDTLLSLSALRQRGIDHTWCVNVRNPEAFGRLSRPFFDASFGDFHTLGNLPEWGDELLISS